MEKGTLTLDRRPKTGKGRTMRGRPLHYNAGLEARYRKQLIALIGQMTAQTEREIRKLFETDHAREYFAMDAAARPAMDRSVASQARMVTNALKRKFDQLFNSKAQGLALGMVNQANRISASTTKSSLKELSQGMALKTESITPKMKEIMTASTAKNVSLIKSIPAQYHQQVQTAVMNSITQGNGMADLQPALQKFRDITTKRANLIAKDQTRQAYNGLNFERMKNVGVQEYEWLHSGGDVQPRELHLQLNGQTFRFDQPPIIQYGTGSLPEVRGKPGDLINCTCKAIPVIRFDTGEDE